MRQRGTRKNDSTRKTPGPDQENPNEENGNRDTTPRKRPLLVVLKSQQEKNTILKNASKLKNNEHYRPVYVKEDQMPHERKEWARLRAVLKAEKTHDQKMQLFP